MKKVIFTGAAVAIVTPFHEDGSINFAMLENLIDYQIENSKRNNVYHKTFMSLYLPLPI